MGDMLSQAEIDALLNGGTLTQQESSMETVLTPQEIDTLGEVGNISMGNSATALYALLGNKVLITTPTVMIVTKDELKRQFQTDCIVVKVEYTTGLTGSNLLIMKLNDSKIITNLMMGGDGINVSGDITELELSAIGEAMNQMIGSAATSMSSMFNKRIDISPPKAVIMDLGKGIPFEEFNRNEHIVKISFRMVVGELIDSEIMQLLPIEFAKDMVEGLVSTAETDMRSESPSIGRNMNANSSSRQINQSNAGQTQDDSARYHSMYDNQDSISGNYMGDFSGGTAHKTGYETQDGSRTNSGSVRHNTSNNIDIQPAEFQSFGNDILTFERKNISLIMDVPLQITVELGRTHKLIREILEFGPGSIVELDKLAGEPVDILVNGKNIAKGEVIVIDESFGVRITDIADPSKRI